MVVVVAIVVAIVVAVVFAVVVSPDRIVAWSHGRMVAPQAAYIFLNSQCDFSVSFFVVVACPPPRLVAIFVGGAFKNV